MRFRAIALLACLTTSSALSQQPAPRSKVQVIFDTTEAAIALTFIEARKDSAKWTDADWKELWVTDGYHRYKLRETEMQRPFTDTSFIHFLLSDSLAKRAKALRTGLSAWEKADLRRAAAKALAYLPANARVAATIYVVIKPAPGSFYYDLDKDPAYFVYLDPKKTAAQFENTIAHELHHLGSAGTDSVIAPLLNRVRVAAEWTRAFGEGFAMLAAAGGPDIHPHATGTVAERAQWDADMKNFNRDLKQIEEFFLGIISRKLETPDEINGKANEFYGVEGPWYTVGWKLATTIERRFGRAEVVASMADPFRLFDRYNAAAADYNKTHPTAKLALWSPELVAAMKRPTR